MKRLRLPFTLSTLALLSLASAPWAEPVTYNIDKNHTVVGFNVRHFFSKVPGRFNDFSGTILLDEKNLPASAVDVTIQTTSIYTNHEKRDNHLRSPDFLDAEKNPTLTFKSTKITPGPENTFKVAGDLTIRGVTKPVVLDATFLGAGPVGAGAKAGFEATTTINRKDYGVLWNRTLDQGGTMLGDDVLITLQVEADKAMPEAAKTEPAKPAATPTNKK